MTFSDRLSVGAMPFGLLPIGLLATGIAAGLWYALDAQSAISIEGSAAVLDEAGDWRLTLTMHNSGGPDRLLDVVAGGGIETFFVGAEDESGLPIPAGMSPQLALDGAHIRARGEALGTQSGQLLALSLEFADAGSVRTKAVLQNGVYRAADGSGLEIPLDDAPKIALTAEPDGEQWRIRSTLENFRFAPELVGLPHLPNEGHGHLYIGGLKIGRVLEEETVVGQLPPGRHAVRITLNTNDHRTCLAGGEPIADQVAISVSESGQ